MYFRTSLFCTLKLLKPLRYESLPTSARVVSSSKDRVHDMYGTTKQGRMAIFVLIRHKDTHCKLCNILHMLAPYRYLVSCTFSVVFASPSHRFFLLPLW